MFSFSIFRHKQNPSFPEVNVGLRKALVSPGCCQVEALQEAVLDDSFQADSARWCSIEGSKAAANPTERRAKAGWNFQVLSAEFSACCALDT